MEVTEHSRPPTGEHSDVEVGLSLTTNSAQEKENTMPKDEHSAAITGEHSDVEVDLSLTTNSAQEKENTMPRDEHSTAITGEHSDVESDYSTVVAGFDLDRFRLPQNFSELSGVRKILTTVPVRKPNRHEFVRVRDEDGWSFEAMVLELKEERETYLVGRDLLTEVSEILVPKVLYTTINRQGVLFLWPIRLPGEDGRHDEWNRSNLEAAGFAKKRWVRVSSNMSLGAYDVFEAQGNLPDPEWPKVSFNEILNIGFKGRIIEDANHPVLKRLRGEI